ncbi:hypothetical protein GGR52DRAFT_535093 [Hypoxylon sp. FL1284]|nr:hypothetical protein GGR52DRAFT_535093 [Hypoxylon sp. FL1284]
MYIHSTMYSVLGLERRIQPTANKTLFFSPQSFILALAPPRGPTPDLAWWPRTLKAENSSSYDAADIDRGFFCCCCFFFFTTGSLSGIQCMLCVCVYMCVYVCMCAYLNVTVYACICSYVHVDTFVHIWLDGCMYMYGRAWRGVLCCELNGILLSG